MAAELVRPLKLKDRIGKLPCHKGKGNLGKRKDRQAPADEDNADQQPVTPESHQPLVSSPDIQPESDEEEEHECLLSEASRIIVPGSSIVTGLDSTDASLILAAVLSSSVSSMESSCFTLGGLYPSPLIPSRIRSFRGIPEELPFQGHFILAE